jgi:serine/threonine-protein kinase
MSTQNSHGPVSRTVGYEETNTKTNATSTATSITASSAATVADESFAHTIATDRSPSPNAAATPPTRVSKISTVLPALEGDGAEVRLVPREMPRYSEIKKLGEGGMGEVALAMDEDIGRKIALKRLHSQALSAANVARFVDEVHIVGQLEHPNIVPIHDVGIDEQGRYFFVMKYVEGETLEHVIDQLRQGNPAYRAKYTIEKRVELFMGVLRALSYAHANGIVHRDLKPANVMVGPYGEVMLMDWGIAKPMRRQGELSGHTNVDDPEADKRTESVKLSRRFSTRHGSLIGTPAYMSPEQALGLNDQIDERSDMYSAIVMLHELLTLRHYLHDKQTVSAMLTAISSETIPVHTRRWYHDAPLGPPPSEYLYLFEKGFSKKPEERFQSAGELIDALQAILEGRCDVRCPLTMTKRLSSEVSHFVDRKPWIAFFALITSVVLVLSAIVVLVHNTFKG